MKLHILQDMATGMRMPLGGTRAEFTNDLPPRLFPSRAAALTALRAWRLGHWTVGREWESTNEYGDGYYVSTAPEPRDSPSNAERMVKRQAMDIRARPVRLEVDG